MEYAQGDVGDPEINEENDQDGEKNDHQPFAAGLFDVGIECRGPLSRKRSGQ